MSQLSVFDYHDLDGQTVSAVQGAVERIKLRMRRSSEDIVQIGLDLIMVKSKLSHGQYEQWLQKEFSLSDRTARRFIQVAENFSDKTDIVSVFSPTALFALASSPTAVVEDAVDKAKGGEKVTAKEINEWKRKAVAEEKARKKAEVDLEEERKIRQCVEEALQQEQDANESARAAEMKRLDLLRQHESKLAQATKRQQQLMAQLEQLEAEKNELANREPTVVEKERLIHVPPSEEAIAAANLQLEELQQQIAQTRLGFEQQRTELEKQIKRDRQRAEAAKLEWQRQESRLGKGQILGELLNDARATWRDFGSWCIEGGKYSTHLQNLIHQGAITPEIYNIAQTNLATVYSALSSLESVLQQGESAIQQDQPFIDVIAN